MTPPARILLLHGIWMRAPIVWPLARRLRAAGLQVEWFDYASIFGHIDNTACRLQARLQTAGVPVGIIGHSLGGLMALEAVRRAPALPVSRIVCLGSPLLGSHTACTLARHWGTWTLGGSAALLQSGIVPWTGRTQVGMVAGTVARGVGSLLARLPAPSDGTVSLAETHLPGLTDHCTVHASHTSLLFSHEAAHQSLHFLKHGCFAAS